MAKTPKTPKTEIPGENQTFTVTRPVRFDHDDYAEGDAISLDRATYDVLAAAGAIEGEWAEIPAV